MPSDCCVGCAASSRNRRRCASDSKRRLRTTTRRRRAGVSRSSSSARRSAGTSRRYSTRGSGNAPELDPVRRAACEQLLAVDLVRPAKEVRRRLIGRRPEHGEPERNVRRPPLVLRPLEIGEPLLERRTFCVTLAHRCHTLGGGPVAQLVEQGTFNPKAAGSNPARPIKIPANRLVSHLLCSLLQWDFRRMSRINSLGLEVPANGHVVQALILDASTWVYEMTYTPAEDRTCSLVRVADLGSSPSSAWACGTRRLR